MDRYMKGFVFMSMVYLFLGSILGLVLVWHPGSLGLRFAHVHFNLLGFMAMMIFGVGYFILPRFSGRTLMWPGLVAVHFWTANLSLWGMVVFYPWWMPGWIVSACVQALGGALFLVNVGMSLMAQKKELPAAEEPASDVPTISADTKVAELLDRWPQVRDLLVQEGIKALSDPGHLDHVRKLGVTLGMMARRHKLNERALLEKIGGAVGAKVQSSQPPPGPITGESVIGDVIKKWPQTEEVFRRHYGEGCFSCPGQAFETIAQSALIHKADLEKILMELNEKARAAN